MNYLVKWLEEHNFTAALTGISALGRYFGERNPCIIDIATDAQLTDMARGFDNLVFPGIEGADAVIPADPEPDAEPALSLVSTDTVFSASVAPPCIPDSGDRAFSGVFPVSPLEFRDFRWDAAAKTFFYPGDTYPLLRSLRDKTLSAALELSPLGPHRPPLSGAEAAFTASLLARFPFSTAPVKSSLLALGNADFAVPLTPMEQRILLIRILTGKQPGRALNYLHAVGFISRYWPELAALETASHSKEFHPEGDGWKHTLEALGHRKTAGLTLSLGILLHDVGKPRAGSRGGKRYDGHAELGAGIARRFLERLEFSAPVIENTVFLVKNHMLPAAFPSLPLYRIRETLESPLAPLLLELYRCDEASSFRRLQGYYAACETYKSFLKSKKSR